MLEMLSRSRLSTSALATRLPSASRRYFISRKATTILALWGVAWLAGPSLGSLVPLPTWAITDSTM